MTTNSSTRFFSFLTATFLIILVQGSIQAEIQNISLKWTAGQCNNGSCSNIFSQQFARIQGVSEFNINLPQGQATLHWKPGFKFTYGPINTAMALVGLSLNDIHVTVKGTITHDAKGNFTLTSLGDGTIFVLMNPIKPAKDQYVEQFSPYNRSLTPELQTQLIAGQTEQKIATITGALFQPERSPPLQLVIEDLSFSH